MQQLTNGVSKEDGILFWFGVIQKGRKLPCWSGIPKGQKVLLVGSSNRADNPVGAQFPKRCVMLFGTRFCLQSLVCYTFCNRRRLKGNEASWLIQFKLPATRKNACTARFSAQTFLCVQSGIL